MKNTNNVEKAMQLIEKGEIDSANKLIQEFTEEEKVNYTQGTMKILKYKMAGTPTSEPTEVPPPIANSFSIADMMAQLKMPKYKEGATLETMKGSEKDSHFLVIGKKSGLKIGIRPLVIVVTQSGVPYLFLAFRLRVEPFAPDGNVLLAGNTFGMVLSEKHNHASIECGIKIVQIPCPPSYAFKVWQDNMITHSLVSQLVEKLTKENVQLIATHDQIVEYLNLVYETCIPNTPINELTEFNIVYDIKSS